MNYLSKIVKAMMTVARVLAQLCLTGTVLCTLLQVFTRYVLHNAIPWTEQMTRFFFIWAVSLGIPLSFYEGGSFKFDILIKKLGDKVNRLTDVIVWIACLGFSGYYFYWGLKLTLKAGAKVTTGIQIPYYFLYGAQVVCAFLLFVVLLDSTIRQIKERRKARLGGEEGTPCC